MAYYRTCPMCGANLDPGEKCDCIKEKERFSSYIKKNTDTGQYTFCLGKGIVPARRQENAR